MTRKSPSAPRQAELIRQLSEAIGERHYLFVNDAEMSSGSKIPDGTWMYRVETFLNDPETSIGSTELERQFAMALITRQYQKYLNPALVKRLTAPLEPVKRHPSTYKVKRLEKVKLDIQNLLG